jgi:hypothetical protein
LRLPPRAEASRNKNKTLLYEYMVATTNVPAVHLPSCDWQEKPPSALPAACFIEGLRPSPAFNEGTG